MYAFDARRALEVVGAVGESEGVVWLGNLLGNCWWVLVGWCVVRARVFLFENPFSAQF